MVVKHIDGTVEEIKETKVKDNKKQGYRVGDIIENPDYYVILNKSEKQNSIVLECARCILSPAMGLFRYAELLGGDNICKTFNIDKKDPSKFPEVKAHVRKIRTT